VWPVAVALLAVAAVVMPARAETPAPRELFERMRQSYNQIHAYQCLLNLFARKGKKTERMKLQFTFKKPGMLRARVLEGPNSGSEVAINRDGRIRGRQRGLLQAVKLTLKPDDGRLRNIRGTPVWNAEWGAFLNRIEEALERPSANASVRLGEAETLLLDIRLQGSSGPERHLYTVEPSTYLLRSGEIYEGDVLVSRVACEKEKLNPDLSDGYFNM
jgi:outer membrane lipoprotein-sorting protein